MVYEIKSKHCWTKFEGKVVAVQSRKCSQEHTAELHFKYNFAAMYDGSPSPLPLKTHIILKKF